MAGADPGAKTYPNTNLKIVVPFPAGTAPDVLARVLGEHLQRSWGKPVVVDNRPGAAGIIGADHAAKSAPDGHTLFMAVNSIVSINPHVYRKLPYDSRRDFTPVTQLTWAPYALVTAPGFEARTIDELVSLAKTRPDAINYATPGVGSGPHVIMALFSTMAGIRLHHVPFKTTGLTEIMGGQVEVSFEPIATAVPMIQTGKVRALAVSSPRRLAALPELPAIAERYAGFNGDGWHGIMVPAQTPPEAVETLHLELTRILRLPDVVQRFEDLGLTVVGNTPTEFAAMLEQDYTTWGKVVRNAGISIE